MLTTMQAANDNRSETETEEGLVLFGTIYSALMERLAGKLSGSESAEELQAPNPTGEARPRCKQGGEPLHLGRYAVAAGGQGRDGVGRKL
jgi:hypothetical protein